MKHLTALTATITLFTGMHFLPAHAEDSERYDKTIERAAIKRVASKLGELRGGISVIDGKQFVTNEDMQPILTPPGSDLAHEKISTLPPMVMNENIDPVVTGGPYKFDSNGLPIPHHQDRSLSRPPTLVQDLLEAFKVNPYPGDR